MTNLTQRADTWKMAFDLNKVSPLSALPPCSDGGSPSDDQDEVGRAVLAAVFAYSGAIQTTELLSQIIRIHRALPGQGGGVEVGKFFVIVRSGGISTQDEENFRRALQLLTHAKPHVVKVVLEEDASFRMAWAQKAFSSSTPVNIFGNKPVRAVRAS